MAWVVWCGNVCWIYPLYSFPPLRFNCFHQLPSFEHHHKFTNSRQCKVLWSAFWAMMFGCALILRMKPIRHWWQAVNFHCTWPAYYLDFRLRVSLEFDNYFRPQICATYEMCLGILLRQAMEIFTAQFRADKDVSPNFSCLCFENFWFHVNNLEEKKNLCTIKVVYLVPQLILEICSWVCLSVYLYL